MSKGEPGLFVRYCAKDFIDGTNMMDPLTELAYRRICDLIYNTNNRLVDDDRMLAWATKALDEWPRIKVALTTGDKPKLVVVDGFITNERCSEELAAAETMMAQKSRAGRASAATGKSLKNLKRSRTAVRDATERDAERSPERDTELTIKPLNQEDSEAKASAAEAAPTIEIDPVKILWNRGLALLRDAQLPEARARRLIGQWRQEFGDVAVMAAIAACEHETASEPVSFIVGCLKHSRKGVNGHGRLTPANERFIAGREATFRAVLDAEDRDRANGASYETRDRR